MRLTGTGVTAALRLLPRDPRSARDAVRFARSFHPAASPMAAQIPWMTYKATRWLDRHLESDMSVFEYGSGGSTIFFAKRVRRVVSVEHDANWHRQVRETLEREGVSVDEYLLREPQPAPPDRPAEHRWDLYTSTDKDFAEYVFEDYVKSIDSFPDASFDLVVVDGRARSSCVHHGLPKVRRGGWLVLDDSDRPDYADAVAWMGSHQRVDFRGISPGAGALTQGSAWRVV